MSPGDPGIRSDTIAEAVTVLRRRAVTVGIEHGDYAAKFVIDDAVIVANLADDPPTLRVIAGHLYERAALLDDTDADEYTRLLAFLEAHPMHSVDWALSAWRDGDR